MSTRPLVVLTREHEDNIELAKALNENGVGVREIPCIETLFRNPEPEEIEQARAIEKIAAAVFTSRRGVQGWQKWIESGSVDPKFHADSLDALPVLGCVGDATQRALKDAGCNATIVADPPYGVVLGKEVASRLNPSDDVLFFRGTQTVGMMEAVLEESDIRIHGLMVYENRSPIIPVLDPFAFAAVFVASPSAVKRLLSKNEWMKREHFIAVGQTTANACKELGIENVSDIGTLTGNWTARFLDLINA